MNVPSHLLAAGLATGLLLGGVGLGQDPGTTLIVTSKQTRLRTGKRLYASAVCDLTEGDKVKVVTKDGAWFRVAFRDQEGWVHESDVTDKKEVRLSGEGVRENYSASEAAAARKGFNPDVEREYKNQNPDLTAAFKVVDRVQAYTVKEDDVVRFMKEGRLIKEESR